MELAINPSKIISSLCYSVLRLEPYTNCSFGCVYCYAKWYRGGRIKPRPKAIGMFSKVAKKLDLRLPFRLATLSDPLQDIEEEAKVSLKLMEIAYQNDIPILLSTKSDRISKNPWKGMIEEMGKNDLIVVQMSVSSLDRQDLEPKAPSPIKKALRYHEKVFLKCLRDSACLNHLTPLLKKVDSKIVAISVDMKRGSEADYQ